MTKKMLRILLVLALLLAFIAVDVQAGWFDKKIQVEKPSKAHRYDVYPTMGFHTGTLRRDTFAGWKLDEVPLQFMSKAMVTAEGQQVSALKEGARAVVMGAQQGEIMVVWSLRILEPDWNQSRDTSRDGEITWSTEDPTVGEGPTRE